MKKQCIGCRYCYTQLIICGICDRSILPIPKYPDYSEYVTAPYNSSEYEDQRKAYDDIVDAYRNATNVYNRNVFIITIIAGIMPIIIGSVFIPPAVGSVGSGLMYGGILTIIYGTIGYFSDMGKLLRVIVIGIALAVLIWIGFKGLSYEKRRNNQTSICARCNPLE